MLIQNNNNANFTGVRFPQRALNQKECEFVADFLSNMKNKSVIKSLDNWNTDIYFTDDLSKVGFAHKTYGHLENYGAEPVAVNELHPNLKLTVIDAIKKISKLWEKLD